MLAVEVVQVQMELPRVGRRLVGVLEKSLQQLTLG